MNIKVVGKKREKATHLILVLNRESGRSKSFSIHAPEESCQSILSLIKGMFEGD